MTDAPLVGAEAGLRVRQHLSRLEGVAQSHRDDRAGDLEKNGHETDPPIIVHVCGVVLLEDGHHDGAEHRVGDVSVEQRVHRVQEECSCVQRCLVVFISRIGLVVVVLQPRLGSAQPVQSPVLKAKWVFLVPTSRAPRITSASWVGTPRVRVVTLRLRVLQERLVHLGRDPVIPCALVVLQMSKSGLQLVRGDRSIPVLVPGLLVVPRLGSHQALPVRPVLAVAVSLSTQSVVVLFPQLAALGLVSNEFLRLGIHDHHPPPQRGIQVLPQNVPHSRDSSTLQQLNQLLTQRQVLRVPVLRQNTLALRKDLLVLLGQRSRLVCAFPHGAPVFQLPYLRLGQHLRQGLPRSAQLLHVVLLLHLRPQLVVEPFHSSRRRFAAESRDELFRLLVAGRGVGGGLLVEGEVGDELLEHLLAVHDGATLGRLRQLEQEGRGDQQVVGHNVATLIVDRAVIGLDHCVIHHDVIQGALAPLERVGHAVPLKRHHLHRDLRIPQPALH